MNVKASALLLGVFAAHCLLACTGSRDDAATTTEPAASQVLPPPMAGPLPPVAAMSQPQMDVPAPPPAAPASPGTGADMMTGVPASSPEPPPPPAAGAGESDGGVGSMAPDPSTMPAAGSGEPTDASSGSMQPSGSAAANVFCDKYEMYCGFGTPMRHADRAACIADFDGNPGQQLCKSSHLDTAIAGTAAACNGMPSEFCFSIHCVHATGLPDVTGINYCGG